MARTNATNFSGGLQFPYATAANDVFKKEDVQVLAQAVDQHTHAAGLGHQLAAGAIPNGTITSAMIVDGTIATADLADGSVTTAKHADASVTNAKLGPDVARANQLTNGGFEIWQRGNGPFTAGVQFAADRWTPQPVGTGTHSTTRDTANADGAGACMAMVVSGSSSTSNCMVVLQPTNLLPQVGGRTLSLSIRVKSAAAGSICSYWYDAVTGGGSSQFGTPVATTTSYTTFTFTFTPATNATALNVGVALLANTTYYLDNAMLVVGSQPCDYVPMHPADDLARCLRYYQRFGTSAGLSVGTPIAPGHVFTTTQAVGILSQTEKALTPTLTVSSVGHFCVVNNTSFQGPVCTALTTYNPYSTSTGLLATVASGLVANQSGTIAVSTGGAWLALEANP